MLFSLSVCGSNSNTTTAPDDTSSITIPSEDTSSADSKEDEEGQMLEL